MSKLFIKSCPLCGNDDFEHRMVCSDHYVSGESFELLSCKACGLTFTQEVPEESEIGSYYKAAEYISHSNVKKGVTNRLYHLVRNHMLGRKSALVCRESGKRRGTVLDIGTGTGYFADAMRRKGWTVDAVEKDPEARAFAKEQFGLEVFSESELDTLKHGKYDAVTMWHVMEHIEDINGMWNRLYDLLSDDGVLILALPNCSSADAARYKEYWAAYDVPRHLWHFIPDTVQRFGAKHNFKLAAYYPMPFDAFYVSILSERYRKSSFPFVRGMVSGIRCRISALGKKERSSSIIYIFRKKRNEQ